MLLCQQCRKLAVTAVKTTQVKSRPSTAPGTKAAITKEQPKRPTSAKVTAKVTAHLSEEAIHREAIQRTNELLTNNNLDEAFVYFKTYTTKPQQQTLVTILKQTDRQLVENFTQWLNNKKTKGTAIALKRILQTVKEIHDVKDSKEFDFFASNPRQQAETENFMKIVYATPVVSP